MCAGSGRRRNYVVPPRWKFAIVVWLAIYPSLTFLVWVAGPKIVHWPIALRTLLFTVVLVPWMVFGAAGAPASPGIVVASGLRKFTEYLH